jgi:hypothetical protein
MAVPRSKALAYFPKGIDSRHLIAARFRGMRLRGDRPFGAGERELESASPNQDSRFTTFFGSVEIFAEVCRLSNQHDP